MDIKEKITKELNLGLSIPGGRIEIKMVDDMFPIVGFVELKLGEEFKVRGYTLKIKTRKTDKKCFLSLDAPAFKAGRGYMKSFIIEDKSLWQYVQEVTLDAVRDLIDIESYVSEDINPEEVPL